MRFRNSLRLLMENFGNVYKMLLYKLAVMIIFAALSAALVVPRLVTILESAQWLEFVEYLKSFFKAVTSGDTPIFSRNLPAKTARYRIFWRF